MTDLFLALAMISGVAEAGERELVLALCVEKTVPRKDWVLQVEAEGKRQRAGPCVVAHFSGPYYDREVAGWIRWQFISSAYSWEFKEQVWYVTGCGKPPCPSKPLTLQWRVNNEGRKMARDMRNAVSR